MYFSPYKAGWEKACVFMVSPKIHPPSTKDLHVWEEYKDPFPCDVSEASRFLRSASADDLARKWERVRERDWGGGQFTHTTHTVAFVERDPDTATSLIRRMEP